MNSTELKEFLDFKVKQYNTSAFIDNDPILIPHMFSKKEDIEISGFLTALISWGNRKAIQKAAVKLMELMDNAPYDFITQAQDHEIKSIENFYYRTFQISDLHFYLLSLQNIYINHKGLENVFQSGYNLNHFVFEAIEYARGIFFEISHLQRNKKHFSSPASGSAAKRINMFLRWMCRLDKIQVDFGIWKHISQSDLICPLDVHSGHTARKLNLLKRKQNDRKAAEELTANLRKLAPEDPVKYDFALFGLSIFEKF